MRWRTGALVAAAGLICGLSLETAAYAQSSADILVRLRRLERDIRDMQAETFRRSPDAAAAAAANPALAPEPEPAAAPAQPVPDLGPMMRRVDELESSVTRLTGQMEEIGHKLDQLALQAERLQKQMEFDSKERTNAQARHCRRRPRLPIPGATSMPP
jgi:phage shock protein A